MNAKRLQPGSAVAVHPGGGHRPEDHWLGVIVKHHTFPDGVPDGRTDVECTDPNGFLNKRPCQVTTVEAKQLRLVRSAVEAQGSLLDLLDGDRSGVSA